MAKVNGKKTESAETSDNYMAESKTEKPSKPSKPKKYHAVILNPGQNALHPEESKPKTKAKKSPPSKVVKKTQRDTLVLPPDHDSYFVYLKHPLEYRRHLLESSRKILFSLRGYQKILALRQRKLDEMRKLKNSVKELMYLNKKFNEMLPKYNMSFVEKSEEDSAKARITPQPLPKKSAVDAKKPMAYAPKSELEKLEESLANIEKKLRTLQ